MIIQNPYENEEPFKSATVALIWVVPTLLNPALMVIKPVAEFTDIHEPSCYPLDLVAEQVRIYD